MQYFSNLEIDNIRKGFYSAVYFNRTQKILLKEKNLETVTMQVFQKKNKTIVAGIPWIAQLFERCTGYFENNTWIDKSKEIRIESVTDGQEVNAWETVMHITGPYVYYAHLESIYLGILARASKVATNTTHVVVSAKGKPVIFFADRFDFFANQQLDGYAANLGGVKGVATPAQSFIWEGQPMGTIPHALIAIHNGNTLLAAQQFAKHFPTVPLIVLVDFDNDCVKTTLQLARHFGTRLYGVRIDTSEKMVDKSIEIQKSKVKSQNVSFEGVTRVSHFAKASRYKGGLPAVALAKAGDERQDPENKNGVTPQLVTNVRNALNLEGFSYVKIVVSGGFSAEKIALFEKEKTPVDMYGVGSSLLTSNIDFTADIVKVENKPIAKQGRVFTPSKRLQDIAKAKNMH